MPRIFIIGLRFYPLLLLTISMTILLLLLPWRIKFPRQTTFSLVDSTRVQVVIGVKTTGRHHRNRLPYVLNTWYGQAPDDVFFVSDVNDTALQQRVGGHLAVSLCGQTHERGDLCCKTGHALEILSEALQNSNETTPESKWLCVVDDDVYVNWAVLRQVLFQVFLEVGRNPVYLGRQSVKKAYPIPKNYTHFFPKRQRREYWFGTGGAGVCLNMEAASKLQAYLSVLARTQLEDRTMGQSFEMICNWVSQPDDVCLGLIMELLLGVPLRVSEKLHSHLENLDLITEPLQQATLSYYSDEKVANVISSQHLPILFKEAIDPTRFLSIHCALHPETTWCPN